MNNPTPAEQIARIQVHADMLRLRAERSQRPNRHMLAEIDALEWAIGELIEHCHPGSEDEVAHLVAQAHERINAAQDARLA